MMTPTGYEHLETRPRKRQLFIKGRKLRAEQIYRETIGEDSRTPEEVARDFDIPLAAVLEAIDYSINHQDLLRQERAEEMARIAEFEKKYPPILPPDYQPQ
jgi:uncharacterized protein (DUF433 family)